MKKTIKLFSKNLSASYIKENYADLCQKTSTWIEKNSSFILYIAGVVLLTGGMSELSLAQRGGGLSGSWSEPNFQDDLIRGAVGNLFMLIEGAFGALIMVVAGLAAIVAAAMGAYRAAVGMLVVAVGAFILRALVSLFFGDRFDAVSSNA